MNINGISTVTVKLDSKDVILNPSEIPTLSENTRWLFNEFGYSESFQMTPLKDRVEKLIELLNIQRDAQNHGVGHKLLGLLRAALTAGVVVAGVLGMIAFSATSAGGMLAVFFTTLIVYYTLGWYNFTRLPELGDMPPNEGTAGLILFAAPFFPIYETLFESYRLNGLVAGRTEQVTSLLNRTFAFFKQDLSKLKDIIQKAIEYTDQRLAALPPDNPDLRYPLEAKKQEYELALKQLDESITYFSAL